MTHLPLLRLDRHGMLLTILDSDTKGTHAMAVSPLMRWWQRLSKYRPSARPLLLVGWLASGYAVARYYRRLVAEHGLSPQALAERADQKAVAFYDHLFEHVALPNPLTVLDIGCGMGDMITYLNEHGVQIDGYLGLDLVDIFVQTCRERYGPPYRFRRENFISPGFHTAERFAIVLNMGGMVSRVVGYEAYIAACCEKMLLLATHTVLFNVITEVQSTSENYTAAGRVGQITTIAKPQLVAILDQLTRESSWEYTLHDAYIYPDAADTFVYLRRA